MASLDVSADPSLDHLTRPACRSMRCSGGLVRLASHGRPLIAAHFGRREPVTKIRLHEAWAR